MNRLFGSAKAKQPKPTLSDAIQSVSNEKFARRKAEIDTNERMINEQADLRVDGIEVKVRKLDAELTRYREQMKKMRDGPAKVV